MGRFSPGVPVIPAEISVKPAQQEIVIPALRRGYLAAFNATVGAKLVEIAPRIKSGPGCDKRGNDGLLTQQMANVNTPERAAEGRSVEIPALARRNDGVGG